MVPAVDAGLEIALKLLNASQSRPRKNITYQMLLLIAPLFFLNYFIKYYVKFLIIKAT